MQWNDHDGPVPNRTEEELLSLAREKAGAIGARRRWQVGAAMTSAVVVVVGLVAAAAAGGSAGTGAQAVSGGPGASKPFVSSTTSPVAALPPDSTPLLPLLSPLPSVVPPSSGTSVPDVPGDASPTDVPAPPAADTVPAGCRNSFDPACGPFRWDPPPGPNQPLTVTVSATPSRPKASDTVTFDVTVDDPDGVQLLDTSGRTVDYGDGTPFGDVFGHGDCVGPMQGSGPWTPPAPIPVHEHLVFQHLYASAGTYAVTLRFKSLGDCAYPGSDGTTTTTVVVS